MTDAQPPESARSDIDRAIHDRGRALLEAIEPEKLVKLSPARWQDHLLEWASEDPDFRVKLLRFVDVLPTLRNANAIADHVRLYFRDDSPAAVTIGAEMGRGRLFRPILSGAVRRGVFAMARRFIAGADAEDAVPRLRRLVEEEGTAFTVDLLGEATLSDPEADVYQARYVELLDTLSGASDWKARPDIRKPNISVKLTALAPHFEPAAPKATYDSLRERLLSVLLAARKTGAFVNIDMEQYRYRDLTHRVIAWLLKEPELSGWSDIGIVVQAYLRDAEDDVDRLAALARERGTQITVRLVKGAYWDEEVVVARQHGHAVPVFEYKSSTDFNFERCTERLLSAYPSLLPAFASHNPRGVAQAIVRSERAGLPPEEVEFQMLYGMAEGLRRTLQTESYRTRVYVPVGKIIPGMGYLVRRLLENTSNESWMMSRHEGADPDEALRTPPNPEEIRVTADERDRFRNHPALELHLPGPRSEMEQAVARVRKSFGRDYPLIIAGKEVSPERWIEVRPPGAPSTVMGRAGAAEGKHVDAAVEIAQRGFPAWRDASPGQRAEVLRRAAEIVDDRRFELASLMVFESGKPWREADGDVTEAIDFLRYYADEAERLARGIDLTRVPGETNHYLYEARGIVGVISPWNFPLAIPCGMTSAALAAGNAVVLKPAHQSPIIASRLVSILLEAGVPEEVLHFLPGLGPEAGERLSVHSDVDMIAFTGSTNTASAIAQAVAEVRPGQTGPRKLLAEMGGKNAIVVDDDADLDLAVEGALRSAFGYAGQKCSAASRVVVVGSAYPEFRNRLAAGVASLAVGPPEDPFTVVPPVISSEARARIEGYIRSGERGGERVAKGRVPEDDGHYVAPHLFEGIPRNAPLAREEIFGPVLLLFEASRFPEAIEIALDSDFALTGGVYSRNPRNIARASRTFRVGNLYLNRPTTGAMVGRQPFGGFRMSGTNDKAGGPDYVQEFMNARVVTENTMRRGFAPRWDASG